MSFLCQNALINEDLITAARNCPHQVVYVKPSKTQLRVLNSIKTGEEVTAQLISNRCDLSESWASTLLKQLFARRYLDRKPSPRQSGGVQFVYIKPRE